MGRKKVPAIQNVGVIAAHRASALGCSIIMFWLLPALYWDSGLSRAGLNALSYAWWIAAIPSLVALILTFRSGSSPRLMRYLDLVSIGTIGIILASVPWVGNVSGLNEGAHYLLAMCHLATVTGLAVAPRSGRAADLDLPLILLNTVSYIIAFIAIGDATMLAIVALLSVVAMMMFVTGDRVMIQLESLRADSEHRAIHDGLTGLLNRDGFIQSVEEAIETGAVQPVDACTTVTVTEHQDNVLGDGTASWLVLLDLVGFKQVNDRFGHTAGDMVLTQVAERLRHALPQTALIARLASDEFAFIISGASENGMECTLGRLLDLMSTPYPHDHGSSEVSASVGTTRLRLGSATTDLMAEADLAMYESKKTTTSYVTHYDRSLKEHFETRIDLVARLRQALADRDIEFWAQPVVLSNNLRPVGVELLARWKLADGSFESPANFIPIAEETGLVVEIGRQALSFAASLLERWDDDPELRDLGVNVNIAASHLTDGLLEDVIAVQPQGDDRLGIEFVESQLILDHEQDSAGKLGAILEELKRRRYRLLIDDFGTGYSSLSYLWAIPLSAIKIDRSLVFGVEEDRTKAGLLTATVAMARQLQVPCVAEGVETDEAIVALNRLGVPILQGFGIARPRPIAETEISLRRMVRNARGAAQELPDTNEFVKSLEQLNADGYRLSVEDLDPDRSVD